MGIISWLRSKLIKVEYKTLINISDIIKIPTRNFFQDDMDKIKLIDKYKSDYLKALSKKNIVTTLDLDSNTLKKDMGMIMDLLLHNIFLESDISSLSNEELLIQKHKLKLYYDEINNMYTDAITRLVALKELYDKKQVLRRNRICLAEEINQLSNSLVIFLNQQASIVKELKTYQTLLNINGNDVDSALLYYRYDKLLFMFDGIINKDDLDKFFSIEEKIAYIEIILEKYTYQNKDEISKLRNELFNLFYTSKDRKDKNKLLKQVIDLEKKFLLFYEYGFNLISEEDINMVYEIKFDILNCDIDYLRKSPIDKNDYGFEYYKKIIFKKIEKIILGKNDYFNITLSINNRFEMFKNFFKDKVSGEFDLDSILLDKYKLNLILCFDRKDGFHEMFLYNELLSNSNEEDKNYFEKFLNIPGIVWEDKVPLTSILNLICEDECNHPLYLMYKKSFSFTVFYELPEGIKAIDVNLLPDNLKTKIKLESAGKKIIFPYSLRSINGEIFDYGTIKISYYAGDFNYETIDVSSNEESHKFGDSVILNNNLQEIGGYVFKGLKSTNLTIPSSVTKIDCNSFEDADLKTITFDDYKNSSILNNEDNLKIFLKIFFKWEQFGGIEITEYDPNTRKMHYYITTAIRANIYLRDSHVQAGRKQRIISNLDSVILKDGEEEIKIDLGRLSTITERFPYPYFWEKLTDYDMPKLLKAFCNLILEKSGYNICEKKGYEKRRN